MKRPDRFSRSLDRLASLSACELRWTRVTLKPVRSKLAGVVARAVVEPSRDIESLRGRMGESMRQALH